MKETLIVDGYNVINAWPELISLKDQNLEHARDALIDLLASYGAYKGMKVVVVFDAHEVSGIESIQFQKQVEVVFTKEGETADSFIERTSYNLKGKQQRVYVVTSDWAEQLVILWAGAYRISARELYHDYNRTANDIKKQIKETAINTSRHELAGRLNLDILQHLDKIRPGH